MAKNTNYRKLRNRKYLDTAHGRDVYNEQQLDRGHIEKKQTMTSRYIIMLICAILSAIFMYFVYGFVASMALDFQGISDSVNTASTAEVGVTEETVESVGTDDVSEGATDGTSGDGSDTAIEKPKREPTQRQLIVSLLTGFFVFVGMYPFMKKNLDAQNMLRDTEDINQYANDQHIQVPEEVMERYDIFPDVGAVTDRAASSLLAHAMISNKGINKIKVPKRHKKDVLDEHGEVEFYEGEIIVDDDEQPIYETVPMFDTKFAEALYDASNAPKEVRMSYDPTRLSYNPGNENREKLTGKEGKNGKKSKFDTYADVINKDWVLPDYEPQRPAGIYVVDTAPVNTMVLAMTRAGKGQTYIEPMIDIWTRERRANNMVINDPKGELLVKFYARGAYRGFQIVQFNLINPLKTDIYNPLGMAAQAAREGDFTNAAAYVENIAEVFFPLDGGEDPVWPNAANNAFKRAAYGLIDYYLEEEQRYRKECNDQIAKGKYIDPQVIETNIDQMWGKVTLYNCYQMFVQLTAKKIQNPAKEFAQKMKGGEFEGVPEEQVAAEAEKANLMSDLWNGQPEADCLTLFFNATEKLPANSMRTLVNNANNALKSMGAAEKMLASVYGIAITAMSFFTDPTISTLTSGTPSQTVDLAGYSFPRRVGVRFHADYVKKNHYVGLQCKWEAFADKEFKESLGKLFKHTDLVTREGWARYYFDGKFEKDIAYVKLSLFNSTTNVLVHEYYFELHKDYMKSLDGRTYVKDPVLGTKIAKNGSLMELRRNLSGQFEPGMTTFSRKRLVPIEENTTDVRYNLQDEDIPCITQSYVRYAEKPKMTFLVTPPHLMKYAKLILILIKQLVDLNFAQSYMTKENQKPLYKTRYMLDELGNLQSEGHGISGFETMLSIGLGQEQQFTLILQTLQQLKDVYGDSVDKIVQGNVANIVFLKSTDDSMLKTLETMSGTTHKSYIEQKTVTRDMEKLALANEGKATYTMSTKEQPTITYNDMAFLAERNSIVFRAGDAPIWNKNEMILPMSWRLFGGKGEGSVKVPGKDFTLQTIPTLSSAVDFDLKKNQPDFNEVLRRRMEQAVMVDAAVESYKSMFEYDDDDFARLDIDVRSDDIMDMINTQIARQRKSANEKAEDVFEDDIYGDEDPFGESDWFDVEENTDVTEAVKEKEAEKATVDRKIYAHNQIAKSDLVNATGVASHMFDDVFVAAYTRFKGDFMSDRMFKLQDGDLYDAAGKTLYIKKLQGMTAEQLNEAINSDQTQAYAEADMSQADAEQLASYEITDDFYRFLASLPSWEPLAHGRFDEFMAKEVSLDD